MNKDLGRDFFARDTLTVARELIGTTLTVGRCSGRIVETEAYTNDAASHHVMRPKQAAIMSETHGHIYVYLIYGMYHCLNFTTDENGPGAVLIRAVQPLRGVPTMQQRRQVSDVHKLARGPGCVCIAFGIDRAFNTLRIGGKLKLRDGDDKPVVVTSPRIGITRDVELPWRFFEQDNPFVSGRSLASRL